MPDRAAEAAASTTTRERILEVALELFVRKGYAETSLREISAQLGLTKAALYYHFESKQDILMALHLRVHELTDRLLPLVTTQSAGDEAWERVIGELLDLAVENRLLLELQLRNMEAINEMHRGPALARHASLLDHDPQEPFRYLLGDPGLPVERRVRRMASLASVLLTTVALPDVSDDDLKGTLREIVHDMLRERAKVEGSDRSDRP